MSLRPLSMLALEGTGARGGGPALVSREDTQAIARAFLDSLGGMSNAADLLAVGIGCKKSSAVRELKGWRAGHHRMRADTYDRLWCLI